VVKKLALVAISYDWCCIGHTTTAQYFDLRRVESCSLPWFTFVSIFFFKKKTDIVFSVPKRGLTFKLYRVFFLFSGAS
jgi:hypothetical protein